MLEAWLQAGLVCGAYICASLTVLELPHGRRVSGASALGPALIVLGDHGLALANPWLLLGIALSLELLLNVVLSRRSLRQAALHVVAMLIGAGMFVAFSPVTDSGGVVSASLAVLVAYLPLGLMEVGVASRADGGANRQLSESIWLTLPVHAVLFSTAALVVFAFSSLGVLSYGILLLVLFAASREFARYEQSRRALSETVHALGALTERAGYVPLGHHRDVALVAKAVALQLGLRSERVRLLEMVALLHDVGSVATSDPDLVGMRDGLRIRESTAKILDEAGYSEGALLLRSLGHDQGAPVEAEVLAVAHEYVQGGMTAEAVGSIENSRSYEDRVVGALRLAILDLPKASLDAMDR